MQAGRQAGCAALGKKADATGSQSQSQQLAQRQCSRLRFETPRLMDALAKTQEKDKEDRSNQPLGNESKNLGTPACRSSAVLLDVLFVSALGLPSSVLGLVLPGCWELGLGGVEVGRMEQGRSTGMEARLGWRKH
jgi:hypothetical protein